MRRFHLLRVTHVYSVGFFTVLSLLGCSFAAYCQEGRLIYTSVRSAALEENLLGDSIYRSVLVYLPPSYSGSSIRRYPTVYLLHGNTLHSTVWIRRLQGWNLKSAMDSQIAAGTTQEMIVVMPDANNRYYGSHYVNSVVTGRWADFVTQDLVRSIDSTYRTLAGPRSRGLAGHSMGGRGTLFLAMKYPGVFGAIYGLSSGALGFEDTASLHDEDSWRQLLSAQDTSMADGPINRLIGFATAFSPNPERRPFLADFPYEVVDGQIRRVDAVWQKWLAHDPMALIKSHSSNLKQLQAIRFDCGRSDSLIIANRKFSDGLSAAGIEHVFEEYDGGHIDRIPQRLESKVFPFFSDVLDFERPN